MNNQIKIIQEEGSFVGYLLKAGEVIFRTPPCSDAGVASKLVTEHLKVQTTTAPIPVSTAPVPNTYVQQTASTSAPSITAPRAASGGCGCKRG